MLHTCVGVGIMVLMVSSCSSSFSRGSNLTNRNKKGSCKIPNLVTTLVRKTR